MEQQQTNEIAEAIRELASSLDDHSRAVEKVAREASGLTEIAKALSELEATIAVIAGKVL